MTTTSANCSASNETSYTLAELLAMQRKADAMKKTLTKNEKLQLIGLYAVGDSLNRQLDHVQDAIGELLGIESEGGHYYGHASDQVYEDGEPSEKAAGVMKNLGIKLQKGNQ